MTRDETSESMSSIYRDLHRGLRSWHVWKEMRHQLSQQPIGNLEFIEPVQTALLDSVILAISRVLDNDKRAMSIPTLLRNEPRLNDGDIAKRVHERLLELEPTLDKIKQRRDQYIAHQDGTKRDPPNPLDVLEIDKAIESLKEDFRALGAFLQGSDYVFDRDLMRAQSETCSVMTILRKAWPRSAS